MGGWVSEIENKAKLSQLKLEFGLSLAISFGLRGPGLRDC